MSNHLSRRCLRLSLIALVILGLCACVDEEEFGNTPRGNFEALWKILDERYCFFDYKRETYGLDWDAIHEKYRARISDRMNSSQLFEVCSDMLSELRDGHVNLSASHDLARYWSWQEDFPTNFSDTLLRRYLGTDYRIAAGLKYRVLDDNIGYVYYESFADGIGEGNLDEVLSALMLCRGLILDIRSNTGGLVTNAERLAARFIDQATHVGYIQHKTGKGHSDFSSMERQILEPSSNIRWHKPVCVLTNRQVYSAANEFVKYMRHAPHATIAGDRTGGGAGLPFSSSLPNGWTVRFSACPMYDSDGRSTEFGIEPDHAVGLLDSDFARGRDTIIEWARQWIALAANKQ